MSDPFSSAVEWFQGLPTWAKIAVPVAGAGVVLLIWSPWKSTGAGQAATETGLPSGGGSATGGAAGNPNPLVATGTGIPASYSTPPSQSAPTYYPSSTSTATTKTLSPTTTTTKTASTTETTTGSVTTTGSGSEILTPHPVHPRAAVRPKTPASVVSNPPATVAAKNGGTLSTETNPSTGSTSINLHMSHLTGPGVGTAKTVPVHIVTITNPSTGQKSIDLHLSGAGTPVTSRAVQTRAPVRHPATVYVEANPSTGSVTINRRLSDLTSSTRQTVVVDPTGRRTRVTREPGRTYQPAPVYAYHPETSAYAPTYRAQPHYVATRASTTSISRVQAKAPAVRFSRVTNASTGSQSFDLRR